MITLHRSPICIALAFAFVLVGSSQGATTALNVFVPPEAGINPDGNEAFRPFDAAGRFQQVYDKSAFEAISSFGGGWIRAIVFRVDVQIGHPFQSSIENIQLNLSTTQRSSDGLSIMFEDNVGPDDTIVIGPRSLRLSGIGGGGLTTFDVLFDLSTLPFLYNPQNGNLLLDFRINQGIGPIGPPQGVAILDAFNVPGDSISSVYAPGVGPLTGQASSLGLATDFVIFPVPEPSTVTLLAVGLLFVGGMGWKRMKKQKEDGNVPA